MEKANIPPPSTPAFHAVDATDDPSRLVAHLNSFNGISSAKSLKKKAMKRLGLKENSVVADLGCGVGDDTHSFASRVPKGRVIGVDSSSIMISEAEKRWRELAKPATNVEFKVGNICKLPFEDASIDCCYVDRVLQHLEDPTLAIHELLRTTKRDGRVVIIDHDWTSLHVNPSVTFGPIRNPLQVPELIDISHRILSLAPLLPTCTYSAGPLWHRMCRDTKLLLKSQGKVCTVSFKDVKAETVAVTINSYKLANELLGLDRLVDLAVTREVIRVEEARVWREDLARCDAAGLFRSSVLLLVVSAQKEEVIE